MIENTRDVVLFLYACTPITALWEQDAGTSRRPCNGGRALKTRDALSLNACRSPSSRPHVDHCANLQRQDGQGQGGRGTQGVGHHQDHERHHHEWGRQGCRGRASHSTLQPTVAQPRPRHHTTVRQPVSPSGKGLMRFSKSASRAAVVRVGLVQGQWHAGEGLHHGITGLGGRQDTEGRLAYTQQGQGQGTSHTPHQDLIAHRHPPAPHQMCHEG